MVLFRCITGEAWNGIMYDLMVTTDCTQNPTWADTVAKRTETGLSYATIGCTPGAGITRTFFLAYVVFASFVFLNLFVAVIIEGFETQDDEDQSTLAPEHLKMFCETWITVRPRAACAFVAAVAVARVFPNNRALLPSAYIVL